MKWIITCCLCFLGPYRNTFYSSPYAYLFVRGWELFRKCVHSDWKKWPIDLHLYRQCNGACMKMVFHLSPLHIRMARILGNYTKSRYEQGPSSWRLIIWPSLSLSVSLSVYSLLETYVWIFRPIDCNESIRCQANSKMGRNRSTVHNGQRRNQKISRKERKKAELFDYALHALLSIADKGREEAKGKRENESQSPTVSGCIFGSRGVVNRLLLLVLRVYSTVCSARSPMSLCAFAGW